MWAVRLLLLTLASLVLLLAAVYGAGALWFRLPFPGLLGGIAAVAFFVLALAGIGGLWVLHRGWTAAYLAAALLVLGWFAALRPTNDRVWQPDVARTPTVEIEGDRATVRNVRNFAWTSEREAEERWEDRSYDLGGLNGVDLIASYWAGPKIAHIILSFGFADRDFLAISIETRKEIGEEYSALAGFFKEYELVYVAADERDVLGVRTIHRGEDVHLYRLRGTQDQARALFLDYARAMNELARRPQFYDTLVTNCTTQVLLHARHGGNPAPWDWKVLLSGYAPDYAYERQRLDTSIPFDELAERSRISARARAIGDRDPDFSLRIREGLPDPRVPQPLR
jgi:hypothetical protein